MRAVSKTLDLIDRGGPFPHARDGAVFGNIDGRLPPRSLGYYREYTVPSAGMHWRGGRRIVIGDRDAFYTDDHYRTFVRIDPGRGTT